MDLLFENYVSFSNRVYDNYKKRLALVVSDLTQTSHGKRRQQEADQNDTQVKMPLVSCDKNKDNKEEEELGLQCENVPIVKYTNSV